MRLSASRINTYLKCSWTYYCKYVLKLPDESNDGARRGTVTHNVLELLLKERHRHHVEGCKKGLRKCKSVMKLVRLYAEVEGVADAENLELIYGFIQIGLQSDFFCEEYELLPAEEKFHLKNEEPKYEILGFIDKSAKGESEALIVDYKTSKSKPSGKDKDFNVQALTYALALWKRFPHIKTFKVRFLFLKFVRQPVLEYNFRVATLRGFEKYLENVYKLLSNFNAQKACSNFCKNNDYWRLCGKAPGVLKKDGTQAWVCPLKFSFLYWEVTKDGEIVKTAKEREQLEKYETDEYVIEQKLYRGCPAWNKNLFRT